MEVTWRDACSLQGWNGWAEVQAHKPTICKTYGRLTHKTKRHVTVAQNIGEHGDCGDVMAIPREWVVKIRHLPKEKK